MRLMPDLGVMFHETGSALTGVKLGWVAFVLAFRMGGGYGDRGNEQIIQFGQCGIEVT